MKTFKMLSCPFCGSKPFFTQDANNLQFIYVRCMGCQCRTAAVFAGKENGIDFSKTAAQKLVNKWNSRKPLQNKVQQIISNAYDAVLDEDMIHIEFDIELDVKLFNQGIETEG